jgi:hypothetical protein
MRSRRQNTKYNSSNADTQTATVQIPLTQDSNHPQSLTGARYYSLGTRYCPFVLSHENEIIIEQLELGAILETTLTRLGFVIDFSKFL